MNDQQSNNNHQKYQLIIDRSKCVSAATCVALAPETYKLDEQDVATVADNPQDSDQDQLLAARSCPVGAITVIERKSNEQIYP